MPHHRQRLAGSLDGGNDLGIDGHTRELVENDADPEFAGRLFAQTGIGLGGFRDDEGIADLRQRYAIEHAGDIAHRLGLNEIHGIAPACAIGTMPASTAAWAPPEEPPAEWPCFQGLQVLPNSTLSVLADIEYSGAAERPRMLTPEAFSMSTK